MRFKVDLENRLLGIVSGEHKDLGAAIILAILSLLSLFYLVILKTYLLLYRLRFIKPAKLPAKVISVGNLTVGGTGKTSIVAFLAKFLAEETRKVAILSYGYKGRWTKKMGVVSDGERITLGAREAGDEPYMLAAKLNGVPILIGKNRVLTGKYAIERFGSEVIFLDDGFQYWRLVKDLEILVIDALNPFGNSHLLPGGILREPLSASKRADVYWITNVDKVCRKELKEIKELLSKFNPQAPIIESSFKPLYLRDLNDGNLVPLSHIWHKPVFAFASIGNPRSFELTLKRLGISDLIYLQFPDHHFYSTEDLRQIKNRARGKDFIITTEKDAVKLANLPTIHMPILALAVEVNITSGAQRLKEILKNLVIRK